MLSAFFTALLFVGMVVVTESQTTTPPPPPAGPCDITLTSIPGANCGVTVTDPTTGQAVQGYVANGCNFCEGGVGSTTFSTCSNGSFAQSQNRPCAPGTTCMQSGATSMGQIYCG